MMLRWRCQTNSDSKKRLDCRYVVPAASAAAFEAALQEAQGATAGASLTAKHPYCSLRVPLLRQLGVKRFLQLPGYAVLTYPVSTPPSYLLPYWAAAFSVCTRYTESLAPGVHQCFMHQGWCMSACATLIAKHPAAQAQAQLAAPCI